MLYQGAAAPAGGLVCQNQAESVENNNSIVFAAARGITLGMGVLRGGGGGGTPLSKVCERDADIRECSGNAYSQVAHIVFLNKQPAFGNKQQPVLQRINTGAGCQVLSKAGS